MTFYIILLTWLFFCATILLYLYDEKECISINLLEIQREQASVWSSWGYNENWNEKWFIQCKLKSILKTLNEFPPYLNIDSTRQPELVTV